MRTQGGGGRPHAPERGLGGSSRPALGLRAGGHQGGSPVVEACPRPSSVVLCPGGPGKRVHVRDTAQRPQRLTSAAHTTERASCIRLSCDQNPRTLFSQDDVQTTERNRAPRSPPVPPQGPPPPEGRFPASCTNGAPHTSGLSHRCVLRPGKAVAPAELPWACPRGHAVALGACPGRARSERGFRRTRPVAPVGAASSGRQPQSGRRVLARTQ